MSDMKVEVRVAAKLDPSYQSTLERAERAAESYGQEVGAVMKAHDGLQDEMRETAEERHRAAENRGRDVDARPVEALLQ